MDGTRSPEADTRRVATAALHAAIGQLATRALANREGVGVGVGVGVAEYRQVERLMRLALALAGVGHNRPPRVQVHGVPGEEGALPELISINLTDRLADRAADHLAGAILGETGALEALERDAEHLILTEDVQLG